MPSITETLVSMDFDPKEAEIYLILAKNGELHVSDILEQTDLSRQSVHDALNTLYADDYIDYRKEGRKAFYKARHPDVLFGLVEQKKRETALLEKEMKQTVKQLTGMYRLANIRPGVRFFEGKEGFEEALEDTLTSSEEIYTFVDLESVEQYADDINKAYVEKRRKKRVGKKLLALDTPANRAYMKRQGGELSDVRFLPSAITFHIGMQIYDGKISYFTLREDDQIAVLIEDKDIYDMHRSFFEFLWNSARKKTKTNTQKEKPSEGLTGGSVFDT